MFKFTGKLFLNGIFVQGFQIAHHVPSKDGASAQEAAVQAPDKAASEDILPGQVQPVDVRLGPKVSHVGRGEPLETVVLENRTQLFS